MAAKRTESTPSGRSSGLSVDGRPQRPPHLAKVGQVALTAGIFLMLWMAIRIKVVAPPVQEHRSASIMMLTPGADPMHWIEAARDFGPFPTRFDPAAWPPSRTQVATVLETRGSTVLPAIDPPFFQLPEHEAVSPAPLIAKGSRILPAVTPPPARALPAAPVRLAPMLYPLTTGEDMLPQLSPRFKTEVTPEMSAQPWRFLLQISADGEVLHATALVGHNSPGRPELSRWLEAHRFPAHPGHADRWIAVAIAFQNQPDDGADDP